MLDKFLDLLLRIVSGAVCVALAIPVLALIIQLFYTVAIFVFAPLVVAMAAVAAWAIRSFMARRQAL